METKRRFLDGPITLAIDAVRALAALMVVAGHLYQLRVFRGAWPFAESFQHVAVVVFFVLSGLVIANSVIVRRPSPADYAIARITRIVPVAALAILFGIAASVLVGAYGTHEVKQPVLMAQLTARSVVMPALFLSEGWFGTGPAWNAPYWSLCYEVWYYALFGMAVYLKGRGRVVCLALGAMVAGPRILLLLPIWLAGAALARSRRTLDVPAETGAVFAAFAVAMIAGLGSLALPVKDALYTLTGLGEPQLRFSQQLITDWAMTPFVVLLFVGLRPLAERFAHLLERCRRPIERCANSSFTLYALHWPALSLLAGFGVATASWWGWLAIVAALQAGAIGIAQFTEAQRYFLRRALKRWGARLPVPRLSAA